MSSFTTTITRMGETWDMISKRVYGDEHCIAQLIGANIAYRDVLQFAHRVAIVVPELPSGSIAGSSLPPWKR